MSALRSIASLLGAAGALAAGAWGGGAFARDAPPRTTDHPPYPTGSGEVAVGDSLEALGQPMRLSVFHTADAPRTVIAFYADAFRARGLLPVLGAEDSFAHVSAFAPEDRLQRFVTALSTPGGQTIVLAGVSDARLVLDAGGAVSVPLPPEHRGLLAFRSADGGSRAQSAHFAAALPPSGVAAFYRETLGKEGFREIAASAPSLLTFEKEATTFSVATRDLGGRRGSAVFVTRVEGAPA